MEQRVKHQKYGVGTIKSERNFGFEKCVHFDRGLRLWIHHELLTPLSPDDREETAHGDHASHSIDSTGERNEEEPLSAPSSGDGFSFYYDSEPESICSEQETIPNIGQMSSGEDNAQPESVEYKESEEWERDRKEEEPSGALEEINVRERKAEEPDVEGRRIRIPKATESPFHLNESLLNAIMIILAVIFLTTIILSTAPPIDHDESPPIAIDYPGDADGNWVPLSFAMLNKYFGTSVIVINTTPQIPLESEPEDEEPLPAIQYDDERFLSTISTRGIPLTIITMQTIIAIDQSNTNLFFQNINALQRVAQESFAEVEGMYVSQDEIQRKRDFQHSMVQFMSAAAFLQRGLPASESERRTALNTLATATEHLDAALRDIGIDTAEADELSLYTIQLSLLSGPAKPDDLLPKNMPFIYMDATRSNEISIYPRYGRLISTFWYETDKGTIHVQPPAGKTYIVVFIQSTHRGNLDGRRYTIQTPALSAFTLHGGGDSFSPIQMPVYTSLGEMYRPKTLNRKESTNGFVVFEVPQTLHPKDTYITINLGSVWGSPGWDLS